LVVQRHTWGVEGEERLWGKMLNEKLDEKLIEDPGGPPAVPGPAGMDSSEIGAGFLGRYGVCD